MDTLETLTEPWPPDALPAIDRPDFVSTGDPVADTYAREGFVVLHDVIPHHLLDALEEDIGDPDLRLDVASVLPVHLVMSTILGEPVGLTDVTADRWNGWRQDGYLQADIAADHTITATLAVGADVELQVLPGSHRWFAPIRNDRYDPVWRADWENNPLQTGSPLQVCHRAASTILDGVVHAMRDAYGDHEAADGVEVHDWAPKRGDVLLRHPRLLYWNGWQSIGFAVDFHYSGIRHRPDLPAPEYHTDHDNIAGWTFPKAPKETP